MTASRGLVATRSASALVLALSSCQAGPHPAAQGESAGAAQAGASAPVVLKLYSGSSTGLVVGAAGGDPGAQLPGLVFARNPGLDGTFIWSFAPGAVMLDGDCVPITRTQAINAANAPTAGAAVFTRQPGAGAVKVQIVPARQAGAGCP